MPIDNNLSDHLVHVTDPNLGRNSIWRWRLTSIGNLVVEITRWYDRLISTMEFPRLEKKSSYIISELCIVSHCTCGMQSYGARPSADIALTKACGMIFSNTFSLIIHRFSKTLSCDIALLREISPIYTAKNLKWGQENVPFIIVDGWIFETFPDSKVPGANMGPTWVLSAHDGPHVGPMNLAIR